MSLEENKALIGRYNDAMNGHDIDACATFYAPDAANFGTAVGREGFRTTLTDIFTTFPDGHNTIDEMVAEDDVVVSRHTTTATHLGTPIVRSIHNMKGIHIWHLKDGLITSHTAARDDLKTMQQIGLWPPPTLRQSERGIESTAN